MLLSEKIFARWALVIKIFSSWKYPRAQEAGRIFEEADLADCVLKRQAMKSKDSGELVGTGPADMQHIPWTVSTIGWWTRWKRKRTMAIDREPATSPKRA